MIIQKDSEKKSFPVEMQGAKDVTMQILVGPEDGSDDIIMRKLTIAPGGHTPHHIHGFYHVIKAISGEGILTDSQGKKHPLKPGVSAFVEPNEEHQFLNTSSKPFEFLCIIPNSEK